MLILSVPKGFVGCCWWGGSGQGEYEAYDLAVIWMVNITWSNVELSCTETGNGPDEFPGLHLSFLVPP